MGKRLLADEIIKAKHQNITPGQNTGNTKKIKRGAGTNINSSSGKADQEFQPEGGSEVNRKKQGSPMGWKTKAKPSPTGLDPDESSGSTPIHGFQAKHQNTTSSSSFQAKHQNITSRQNSGNTMKRKRGAGDGINCSNGKADHEFQPERGSEVRPVGWKTKAKPSPTGLDPEGQSEVSRKKWGTPVGLKTKPKASPTGIRELSSTMKNHVVEVPSRYDLIKALGMFARTCEQGVLVMSGSGTVSNVMLLEPAIPEGIVEHAGLFQILSLTGAFPQGCENEGATGLRVRLVSTQGRTVGGTAVGSMIAHSGVVLVLGTSVNIPLERLNVQHFQLPGVLQQQPPMTVQESFPRSHGIQRADKH